MRETPPFFPVVDPPPRGGAIASLEHVMVSATQQSSRIRRRKQSTEGTRNKRQRRAHGTPVFAVHPEGYDATAADARKPEAK